MMLSEFFNEIALLRATRFIANNHTNTSDDIVLILSSKNSRSLFSLTSISRPTNRGSKNVTLSAEGVLFEN